MSERKWDSQVSGYVDSVTSGQNTPTSQEPPAENLLNKAWEWRNFGDGNMLVTVRSGAKVVLSAFYDNYTEERFLAVRNEHGLLVPLTPDHYLAKAIIALPDLINGVRACLDYLEAELRDACANAQKGGAWSNQDHVANMLVVSLNALLSNAGIDRGKEPSDA